MFYKSKKQIIEKILKRSEFIFFIKKYFLIVLYVTS